MIITEKQLQILLQICADSLALGNKFFTYDKETRNKIYDEIINQQNENKINVCSHVFETHKKLSNNEWSAICKKCGFSPTPKEENNSNISRMALINQENQLYFTCNICEKKYTPLRGHTSEECKIPELEKREVK